MFDSNIFPSSFQNNDQRTLEDILTLIDLALDTKDQEWFAELRNQLAAVVKK